MTFPCSALTSEEFAAHELPRSRENKDRLIQAIAFVPGNVRIVEPRPALVSDLERVHLPQHVRMIEQFSSYGGVHYIDMDTYVTGDSFRIALLAAGASIDAAKRALQGEHCFALVRPPGHHAESGRAMGYCLFNNAAIAGAWALERVDRVAIVDWDLHHGNGTQEIFYGSDRVLFCSVHQGGAFPGTGWVDEIGEGRGMGFTLNAPLRPGCGINDYTCVFSEVFCEALSHFQPDLLIVSAGQDPLRDDPLEGMRLLPQDFALLARMLANTVEKPLSLVLEGGYGPSLGKAVAEIFRGLQSESVPLPSGTPRASTKRVVEQLKKVMI
jgi:acetoin utilization deacetylase AcuC-like enzyme